MACAKGIQKAKAAGLKAPAPHAQGKPARHLKGTEKRQGDKNLTSKDVSYIGIRNPKMEIRNWEERVQNTGETPPQRRTADPSPARHPGRKMRAPPFPRTARDRVRVRLLDSGGVRRTPKTGDDSGPTHRSQKRDGRAPRSVESLGSADSMR